MKIGIIGAGIMGLTLGYQLSKAGYQVQIIEAKDQPGGLSTWFDYKYFIWDKYYHVILKQDKDLLHIIEELNLTHKLRWKSTLTGFLWNKQLISMSNYWEFFRFPPLNFIEKLRLGGGILYSRYMQNPSELDGQTATEWLTKVFGKGVFSIIWEPLLKSKYGSMREKVPAYLLCSTINRYYGTRNKSDGKESMGYLSGGGLKNLIECLINKITEQNGLIHCGEKVIHIDHKHSESIHLKTNQNEYQFDKLISTLPTSQFNKLMCPSPITAQLQLPEFLGVIRLALVMDKSLSPYYVTNLIDKELPYTGIVELSQVVDSSELGHKNLIMLPRYDLPSSDWFKMSDDEIKLKFLNALKETWPSIEKHIIQSYVHRESIVQAVWTQGKPNTEPQISKDGCIWSINAELAGCDVLNNNAIVRVAKKSAEQFIARESKK